MAEGTALEQELDNIHNTVKFNSNIKNMKRKIISSLMLVMALASCAKNEISNARPEGQDDSGKMEVRISFKTPSAATKALTQDQEDKINSLAVALYAVKGGESRLEGYYTFSPSAMEGNIYIDGTKDPDKYIIAAYANHPSISLNTYAEDWTFFKDESAGNFQMFGKWEGTESEILSSAISIQLRRQCSKVSVNKISLDWINPANASKEFLIKGIYLMDVEGAFENIHTFTGSQDWFNKNGYFSSDQDALLYAPVSNVTVTESSPYTTRHEFYGYISDLDNINTSATWTKGASRLVIAAKFDGRDCFYAVKINRNGLTQIRNTHFSFNNIKITKPGADTPYGSLIDETAVSIDFSVKPWESQSFSDVTVE